MTKSFYENNEDDENSINSFLSDDLSNDDDVQSSLDGDGSTKDPTTGSRGSREELKFAKTESQFVLCSKLMAYLVLFLSAVAAGFTAFYLTRDQETNDFKSDVSTGM